MQMRLWFSMCFYIMICGVLGTSAHGIERNYWETIGPLLGSPDRQQELSEYIDNLDPMEQLGAARQVIGALEEEFNRERDRLAEQGLKTSDWRELSIQPVLLILREYPGKEISDAEDANQLLGPIFTIVRDKTESPIFREVLIAILSRTPSTRFQQRLHEWVKVKEAGVIERVLLKILEDNDEHPLVRRSANTALATYLRDKRRQICYGDSNVRDIAHKTKMVVPFEKMLQEGQLKLHQDTRNRLDHTDAILTQHLNAIRQMITELPEDWIKHDTQRALMRSIGMVLEQYRGVALPNQAEIRSIEDIFKLKSHEADE